MFELVLDNLLFLGGVAIYLGIGFVLMLLIAVVGRLFNGHSHDLPVGDPSVAMGGIAPQDHSMFNEATGLPLAMPNAMVDVELNPRLLV